MGDIKKPNNKQVAKQVDVENNKKIANYSFNFKIDEYAIRGLNKYKCFFTTSKNANPDDMILPVKDMNEMYVYCYNMLDGTECSNSAIFLIHKNGKQKIVLPEIGHDEEKDEYFISDITVLTDKIGEIDFFAKVDSELLFHSYMIFKEVEKNKWKFCLGA